ncbi:hypothetical protein Tco_1031255 [Tanacetum coccineum]|uniref:Xylulose kinase-1 n=1 Tax=Tanacetum coccineum TaxID=301880 RepID=A0ABQ5G9A2_9ASTR
MANLEFCDKHNMVAYLKKPTGSEGFQEIVDFLNDSYIRYALTKNPTIYVSLIEKFWQTATVRTVDNGEQEITATVDGKEFTITEASVRRHLQLADVDGISVLPTTKIFDQLSLMGYVLTDDKLTFQKGLVSLLPKVPLSVIYKEWYDKVERDTTTAARKKNVDAEQASWCQEAMGGSIAQTRFERVPTPPCDLPLPRVHTLGSDEGSMTLQELMILCTTLSKKVESLEADLKQTKKVYGAAYTKLIKKIEKTLEQEFIIADEEYLEDFKKRIEERTSTSESDQANMLTEDRGRASKLVTGSSQLTIINSAKVGSSKRAAEAKFEYEGSKRQKTNEALGLVQEQPKEEELSNIQSLTGRFTLKNLENIRRSSGLDDLVMLWNLVKERFSSTEPTDDKERTLWVELKRVHHVSTEKGTDIFMLVEKEYLLSKGVLTLMLVNRLLVEQHSKMANELLRKIFIQANRPRQ